LKKDSVDHNSRIRSIESSILQVGDHTHDAMVRMQVGLGDTLHIVLADSVYERRILLGIVEPKAVIFSPGKKSARPACVVERKGKLPTSYFFAVCNSCSVTGSCWIFRICPIAMEMASLAEEFLVCNTI